MSDITLTRLPGYDINGNPRYVCHYSNLLTWKECEELSALATSKGISEKYARAIERSHKIGGRKYHTRAFGGGIVFTDYENVIKAHIRRVVAEAEAAERAEK